MYFIATLQPVVSKKDEEDGFFNDEEKRQVIDKFYASKDEKEIPLCIDHGTGEGYGYTVEKDKRVGKVLDLFNDEYGNIVAKCVLNADNEYFKRINQAICLDGEKWGVSVWIDVFKSLDDDKAKEKDLTHVALTADPYFADQNTFIHHWALQENALDSVIAKEYYTEGKDKCYASSLYKSKLDTFIHNEEEKEPSKVNEEKVEEPVKMDETPSQMNEEPVKMDEEPSKVDDASLQKGQEPVKMNQEPIKVDEEPVKMDEELSNVNEEPAKMDVISSNIHQEEPIKIVPERDHVSIKNESISSNTINTQNQPRKDVFFYHLAASGNFLITDYID